MTAINEFITKKRRSTFVEYFYLPDGRSGLNAGPSSSEATGFTRTVITEPNRSPALPSGSAFVRRPELPYRKKISEVTSDFYVGNYIKRVDFGSYITVATRTGLAQNIGYSMSPSTASAQVAVSQDKRQTQKLLDQIKKQRVNLAQVWAERQQTVNLFSNTVFRLAIAIRSLKKGNILAAAQALGAQKPSRSSRMRANRGFRKNSEDYLSRTWLELQYGWKPLLQDLYGSCDTLANLPFRSFLNEVSLRSKVSFQESKHDVMLGSQSPGIDLRGNGNLNYIRLRRTGVTYYTDLPTQSLSALGITNPALVAWELLPWSFLYDWILPIGDWISSWDATSGCHFYDGYVSVATKVVTVSDTVSRGYANETFTSRNTSLEYEFIRSRLINFPSPVFPEFKNPLSLGHTANALALFLQLRK